MHSGEALPLAPPDLPMDRALLLMTGKGFGCLGVVDADGRLVGIVTDGDLRRAMGPDLLRRTRRRRDEPGARAPSPPDALAAEALRAMNAGAAADHQPVRGRRAAAGRSGILHVHDLLRAGVA